MRKAVYVVLIIVLLGIFGYSAYLVGDYLLEKHRSDVSIAEAAEHVRVIGRPDIHKESGETGNEAEEDEEPVPEGIEVDFDALWKLNTDIVAWLYSPDTPINYPVVQSGDNEYYLRRLLDGSWNIGGTLFLDYRCPADFSHGNNIIYGHQMRSGTMFGSLKRYRDQSYYDAHPVMYLATPAGQYRVELFAGCTVSAFHEIYDTDVTEDQLLELMKQSTFAPEHPIELDGPILTLSTCAYDFENARYIVMGKLVPIS